MNVEFVFLISLFVEIDLSSKSMKKDPQIVINCEKCIKYNNYINNYVH